MTDSAVARLRDTRVQFSDNIAKPSPGDPIPLIGYVDKLSARPGETLQFKVGGSSDGQEATARLMQVICADANPDGPGICEKDLSKIFQLDFKTKAKSLAMGSYVVTNPSRQQQLKIRDSLVGGCTLVATICPTLPDEGQQAIISCWDDDSKDGIMLGIAPGKGATLTVGVAPRAQPQRAKATSVSVGRSLKKHVWYVVWATFDPEKDQASVGQFRVHSPCHDDVADEGWAHMQVPQGFQTIISGTSPPTLAAAVASPSRLLEAKFHFNGKMESPTIYDVAFDASTKTMRQAAAGELVLGLTARWAFDKGISGLHVTDSGDHGLHGTVVNLPTRGVKGSLWSGREHCWRHAPEEYNAIHFHSDDLDDARWDTDFAFTIPQDLPSGAYCMRLRSGAHHDTIPFFVLAALGDAQADLCVVIPTFTYVIYGNHARNDFQADDWHLRASCSEGAYLHNPAEHVEHYGASTYNLHKDGSGICHCTHRRPLLTLKSGFRSITEPGSGVRHFQADTHLLAWLFAQEIAFEVVTDHDLHHEGADCILPYRAVMTCTHPEYHTKESLDALCGYRDKGGRLLYLGGNGFYWRVAVHAEMPGAIEIRRGEGGIRAWASSPGEYYNAFDGQYGGLWRRNGRPPQELAGVGFSAQGLFEGSHYKLCAGVRENERVSWMLEGIDGDVIGNFGLCGGGAAGFELDRADVSLGTPEHAVVLASSEGHSANFVAVFEELLTHVTTCVPGVEPSQLVHADIVFFETRHGGAVFSVGSITFCGSLLVDGGNNNVSVLLRNVLTQFLDPATFYRYGAPARDQYNSFPDDEGRAIGRALIRTPKPIHPGENEYSSFRFLSVDHN